MFKRLWLVAKRATLVVENRQEREPGDVGHSYQFVLEFKYEYGMIENNYGKNKKK